MKAGKISRPMIRAALLVSGLLGGLQAGLLVSSAHAEKRQADPVQFLPSPAQFDALFPDRLPFYTYEGFVRAVSAFPAFAASGDATLRRQEMAAFLANIAHESDELKAVREYNPANHDKYCSTEKGQHCAPGQQYYGRGPIQLSWNYQYLAAGQAIGLDLWGNPDLVARDPKVAWQTAIWYWMNQNGPNTMPAHQAMLEGHGLGGTIRSINGALECDQPASNVHAAEQIARRAMFYRRAVQLFGVPPGEKLAC
ncbi:chitinase [Paucibacter sp. Y2R2-4]|uniref:chitinase n=1 Tax=Paucibacter sp. Y2R2-4 TaxID=2893553 RepID=UPI0021E460C4|nr:chitinase [Paucibacter sp. Y2R2-4]MCV2352291.1 chitinase [Paucibacter sp. Y2R2-4]